MSGQGQKGEGSELAPLILVGIFVAVGMVVYYLFKVEIIRTLFFIKFYELKVISLFAPKYQGLILWMEKVSLGHVDWSSVNFLAYDVGEAIKYPITIILFLICGLLWFFHPQSGYKKKHTMTTLTEELRSTFPMTTVVEKHDLCQMDIAKGPWAMAMTPVEFAKKNKLLVAQKEVGHYSIDEETTKAIFRGAMGPLWRGIELLSAHETFVVAVLAMIITGGRDRAQDLIDKMCVSASFENVRKGALDYGNTKVIVKKLVKHPRVKGIIEKHAYVNTVLPALLVEARQSGIIANSGFLWLKIKDRQLWYTINSVGRQAVFVEVAAIWGHFLTENKMGHAIQQPMIEQAVSGLKEAIESRIIKGEKR